MIVRQVPLKSLTLRAPMKGLVEALADLLLEALDEERTATASRTGDDCEDHA
jgi:hypothetical protein